MTANQTDKRQLPVAVIDSGLGGLTVLKELIRHLPQENFLYFGDTAHIPYGNKSAAYVRELICSYVEEMREQGIKGLVLACNTATAVAVDHLRQIYQDMPIISVEPAIKPAVLAHPGEKVLVMATPITLNEERFFRLFHKYEDQAEITLVPCPGLADKIEACQISGPELREFLSGLLEPYMQPKAAGLVLGCTHYPFVKRELPQVLGYTPDFYDCSAGTARETRRRLLAAGIENLSEKPGTIQFLNSANDPLFPEKAKKMLNFLD